MAQMNKRDKDPKKRLTKEQTEAKKRLAFILYTENGLEQKVISEITGISEVSISRWKQDGNWEDEREQARIGPEKEMRRMRKLLNQHLDEIEQRDEPFPDSKEADAINKITVSIKNLMGDKLMMYHKTEVGRQFIDYIQQTYGQARAVEILDAWHEWVMATS